MRHQPWELPASIDAAALERVLHEKLLLAVDEVARAKRLYDDAQEALAAAWKSGTPPAVLVDTVSLRKVDLLVAVSMLGHARGLTLQAKEEGGWAALQAELQAAGTRR